MPTTASNALEAAWKPFDATGAAAVAEASASAAPVGSTKYWTASLQTSGARQWQYGTLKKRQALPCLMRCDRRDRRRRDILMHGHCNRRREILRGHAQCRGQFINPLLDSHIASVTRSLRSVEVYTCSAARRPLVFPERRRLLSQNKIPPSASFCFPYREAPRVECED